MEHKAGMAGQPEPIYQSAEAARGCPRLPEAARGCPRLEAALGLIWRWRGVLEGVVAKASGRLFST